MKITSIKATPVKLPMDIPYFWSVGLYPGTSAANTPAKPARAWKVTRRPFGLHRFPRS